MKIAKKSFFNFFRHPKNWKLNWELPKNQFSIFPLSKKLKIEFKIAQSQFSLFWNYWKLSKNEMKRCPMSSYLKIEKTFCFIKTKIKLLFLILHFNLSTKRNGTLGARTGWRPFSKFDKKSFECWAKFLQEKIAFELFLQPKT